jgi:hypothetical protein
MQYIPGTKMVFTTLKKPQECADLIASEECHNLKACISGPRSDEERRFLESELL